MLGEEAGEKAYTTPPSMSAQSNFATGEHIADC